MSRAQCLALVVHGAELLEGAWTKIDDLRRLNFFAHAEAIALLNLLSSSIPDCSMSSTLKMPFSSEFDPSEAGEGDRILGVL